MFKNTVKQRNLKKGRKLAEKADEEYHHGHPKQAVFYYRKAADLGDVRATYSLGYLTWRGEGTPKNLEKAFDIIVSAYNSKPKITAVRRDAAWVAHNIAMELGREDIADHWLQLAQKHDRRYRSRSS